MESRRGNEATRTPDPRVPNVFDAATRAVGPSQYRRDTPVPPDPETPPAAPGFDFSAFPPDTCFHERRTGRDRRQKAPAETDSPLVEADKQPARRKQERRRRIDPTTFEKQYTSDELEFMNAMQYYKVQTGKSFPTYGEVLEVARNLGYQREPSSSESERTIP